MCSTRTREAASIFLKQFTDKTFLDYFAIYLEENGEESVFEPELREHIARSAIDPEHSIVRDIWDAESGAALGYCEVQNVKDLWLRDLSGR